MDNTDIISDNGNAGNFIMNSGATLLFGHADGIKSDGSSGNIQLGGTLTFPANENYGFTSAGSMVSADMPATVKNLYIHRSTADVVSLSQTTTVSENIEFSSDATNGGKIQLGIYNLSVTGEINNESSNKYVITNTDFDATPKGFCKEM